MPEKMEIKIARGQNTQVCSQRAEQRTLKTNIYPYATMYSRNLYT